MSLEIMKKVQAATIDDARAWAASDEQFLFCIDFLEISAHDRFAGHYVDDLEKRFQHLIDQVDGAKSKGFANLQMWSDVRPFEITRRVSEKTIELREMDAERLDDPKIIPGGFSGHCVNNRAIRYKCTSNENGSVIRARLRKDGYFHSKLGRHVVASEPHYFYDYNF